MEIPLIVFGCVAIAFLLIFALPAWYRGYSWRKESGQVERRGFISRI